MKNYLRNKIKNRLKYCVDWKSSVDIYLANKEISKKADKEYYKSRTLLKFILDIYFIPYNTLRFLRNLMMLHEYKKNDMEIKVLIQELKGHEDYKR
tara:strand:+ start:91 stop:378 length:288 start_codon:yes stop_codon:yes gene_type:complete